jgi:hypothetical protein
MSNLEERRAKNIAAREAERNRKELLRVQQIRAGKERHNLRALSNQGIKTRNDVLRRLDQLATNRAFLREMIKYKRKIIEINNAPKLSLSDLQCIRKQIITDKIRLIGTTS